MAISFQSLDVSDTNHRAGGVFDMTQVESECQQEIGTFENGSARHKVRVNVGARALDVGAAAAFWPSDSACSGEFSRRFMCLRIQGQPWAWRLSASRNCHRLRSIGEKIIITASIRSTKNILDLGRAGHHDGDISTVALERIVQ